MNFNKKSGVGIIIKTDAIKKAKEYISGALIYGLDLGKG